MRAILFDLDGTLLPMRLEEFTNTYCTLLAKKMAPHGYEPKAMIDALWKGTYAMVKNDGGALNEVRFWHTFNALMGKEPSEHDMELFDEFYRVEFNGAQSATWANPGARELVTAARKRADMVILATNPLFPRQAVKTRLKWAGLDEDDFDYITTYENSSFCKPNSAYYHEILSKKNLHPTDCFMFGNDVDEDMIPATKAGIDTFIITDCLINKSQSSITCNSGTMSDAVEFARSL